MIITLKFNLGLTRGEVGVMSQEDQPKLSQIKKEN
jgi:hypothetical protein